MTLTGLTSRLEPELLSALAARGFTELTSVQEAVLDPALAGRDLRLTSQTGSGKTVALGLAVRQVVVGDVATVSGAARPRVLVVAPTRELAHQVEDELTWLFEPLGVRVVTTTGGSSARDERRALASGPAVVVGTPGRLLDHLSRRSIDASNVAAVVLDEADRMLDLGFREDLTAILGYPPKEHRTHLVSATFPHAVRALADSVQVDPAHVEGTRLGAANVDIDHRIVLVDAREKLGGLVNVLLARPEEQALVFARTRADVAHLAKELQAARFSVGSLSGEMAQEARNRAMSAFREGRLRVLVATDVAARGIDVQDIAHVIHADPPGDADTYTHRSGRTGRAGRKGTSTVLVTPHALRAVSHLMTRAGVRFRVESAPSADEIRRASDDRLFKELIANAVDDAPDTVEPRIAALASRLAEAPDVTRTLARLLSRVRSAQASEPFDVRRIEPPTDRPYPNNAPRAAGRDLPRAPTPGRPLPRPSRDHGIAPGSRRYDDEAPAERRNDRSREWAAFRVTWGSEQGADARRLLAVICRRGGIRGSDVGAIRVGSHSSTFQVAAESAKDFAHAVAAPDPREPNVVITPDRAATPDRPATHDRAKGHRPPTDHRPATNHRPTTRPRTATDVETTVRAATPPKRTAHYQPRTPAAGADRPFTGDRWKKPASSTNDSQGASARREPRGRGGHAPPKRGGR